MGACIYIVKKGDTLSQIAERFFGDSGAYPLIIRENDLSDADKIYTGQALRIPGLGNAKDKSSRVKNSSNYIVGYGDTLEMIAKRKLGSSKRWREIAKLNNLEDPDRIHVGQELRLPMRADSISGFKTSPSRCRLPMGPQALSSGVPFAPGGSLGEGVGYRDLGTFGVGSESTYDGSSLACWPGGDELQSKPATTIPVRAFFFILADEFNPFTEKWVRKVVVPTELAKDPKLFQAFVESGQYEKVMRPDIHGFNPRGTTNSMLPPRRHVASNMTKQSPFLSYSTREAGLPTYRGEPYNKGFKLGLRDKIFGSPRFDGEPFFIDAKKLKASGAMVVDAKEIAKDIDYLIRKTKDPIERARYLKIKELSTVVDREILVRGKVDAKYIKGLKAYGTTRALQFVQGVGIVWSAYDLYSAGRESIKTHSPKPITKASIREVGGWGGARAGMLAAGLIGGAAGIETGPGAIITGAIGALAGGIGGYFGAEWINNLLFEKEHESALPAPRSRL